MAKESGRSSSGLSLQVVNKKAFFNYEIVEKVQAGLSLVGSEVKSLRAGQADLDGSYGRITNGECWLVGCHIAEYPQAGDNNHKPFRNRKVLLHKRQIAKLCTKLQQRGFTLVPLRLYFNERGFVKVELALAAGKKQYDKRKVMQKRQQKKDIERDLKRYRKR